MGGNRIPGQGPNDDGYDEEGYDESQRAEMLETMRDGPTDGTILTDLAPDLGGDPEDEDGTDDLTMLDDEPGEEDEDTVRASEDDEEDELQDDFDNDALGDDDLDAELDDDDDDALEP